MSTKKKDLEFANKLLTTEKETQQEKINELEEEQETKRAEIEGMGTQINEKDLEIQKLKKEIDEHATNAMAIEFERTSGEYKNSTKWWLGVLIIFFLR